MQGLFCKAIVIVPVHIIALKILIKHITVIVLVLVIVLFVLVLVGNNYFITLGLI